MTDDDWEAKYWSNRAKQVAQQQGQQPARRPQQQAPQTREIDAANVFAQRQVMGGLMGRQHDEDSPVVFLREGATYYRQLPNPDGFGTTVPLIRSMGPLTQVQGKQFEMRGEVRGYCVDALPSIDLSKINENPERMITLVKVKAPFVGDILVPRAAIIETSSGGGGKQVLRG